MKKKIARKPVKKPAKKAVRKVVKKAVRKAARKPVRKPVKKTVVKKQVKKTVKKGARQAFKKAAIALEGTLVGEITHYFPQVNAAVVKLQIPLVVGDVIKVKGHTTDFTQPIASLQIDRVAVPAAKVGDEIGLQVKSRVRRGDIVTKL
jgi:putative protease